MAVNSVAFRSAQAPLIQYECSLPLKPMTHAELISQSIKEEAASQRSLDYFSERLKEFAPIEGLFRSGDIPEDVFDAGPLIVRPLELCEQEYDLAQLMRSRGAIYDYFFTLDSSSIRGKAEALVRGETYDPLNLEKEYFVRGLCEFFVGSDTEDVTKSYEALVQEYVDKLKSGETLDINQFKTKFSLSGEETTIGQIFKIRDTALAIRDVDFGSSVGDGMFITFARKGLMRAAAQKYASTLPEGIGKAFASQFTDLVDKDRASSMAQWKDLSYSDGRILKERYQFLTPASNYAFDLFSQSNFTSADFADKTARLMNYIADSGFFMPSCVQGYQRILSDSIRKTIESIS